MDRLGESSHTANLWIQYIRYTDIVKYFIAAERTGNWQNHLGSTAKMLILLAATGHSNYAKSACKAIFANDERIAYRIS